MNVVRLVLTSVVAVLVGIAVAMVVSASSFSAAMVWFFLMLVLNGMSFLLRPKVGAGFVLTSAITSITYFFITIWAKKELRQQGSGRVGIGEAFEESWFVLFVVLLMPVVVLTFIVYLWRTRARFKKTMQLL